MAPPSRERASPTKGKPTLGRILMYKLATYDTFDFIHDMRITSIPPKAGTNDEVIIQATFTTAREKMTEASKIFDHRSQSMEVQRQLLTNFTRCFREYVTAEIMYMSWEKQEVAANRRKHVVYRPLPASEWHDMIPHISISQFEMESKIAREE